MAEDKKDIKIVIDGIEFTAKLRDFKSGKKGYGAYGMIKINDYPFRLSCNVIKM